MLSRAVSQFAMSSKKRQRDGQDDRAASAKRSKVETKGSAFDNELGETVLIFGNDDDAAGFDDSFFDNGDDDSGAFEVTQALQWHDKKHRLYELAVQAQDGSDMKLLLEIFQSHRKREPRKLREDFAGSCLQGSKFVGLHPQNSVVSVELDQTVLAWAIKHNIKKLPASVQKRINTVCSNVATFSSKERFDLAIGFNFSFNVFKSRKELLAYFKNVHASLVGDGVFLLDVFGGPHSQTERTQKLRPILEDTTTGELIQFEWEQEKFDPATNEMLAHINFHFTDGSQIRPAFTVDWRLWSLPELRDALLDSGFSAVHTYLGEDQDDAPLEAAAGVERKAGKQGKEAAKTQPGKATKGSKSAGGAGSAGSAAGSKSVKSAAASAGSDDDEDVSFEMPLHAAPGRRFVRKESFPADDSFTAILCALK